MASQSYCSLLSIIVIILLTTTGQIWTKPNVASLHCICSERIVEPECFDICGPGDLSNQLSKQFSEEAVTSPPNPPCNCTTEPIVSECIETCETKDHFSFLTNPIASVVKSFHQLSERLQKLDKRYIPAGIIIIVVLVLAGLAFLPIYLKRRNKRKQAEPSLDQIKLENVRKSAIDGNQREVDYRSQHELKIREPSRFSWEDGQMDEISLSDGDESDPNNSKPLPPLPKSRP